MQRRLERSRSIVCCTVFFLQALGLPKKLDSFYSPCVFSWIPGALIGCTSSRKFKVPTGEFDGLVYTDGKGDPPSPSKPATNKYIIPIGRDSGQNAAKEIAMTLVLLLVV
jgi:hypothetical protein